MPQGSAKLTDDDIIRPARSTCCLSRCSLALRQFFSMLCNANKSPIRSDGVRLKKTYMISSAIMNMIAISITIFPIELDRHFLHHTTRAILSISHIDSWPYVIGVTTVIFALVGIYRQCKQNSRWQKDIERARLVPDSLELADQLKYHRYQHPAPQLAKKVRVMWRMTMVNFALDVSNLVGKRIGLTGWARLAALVVGVLAIGIPLWRLRHVNEHHINELRTRAKSSYYQYLNYLLWQHHNSASLDIEAPLLFDSSEEDEPVPGNLPPRAKSRLLIIKEESVVLAQEVRQTYRHAFRPGNCGKIAFSVMLAFMGSALYAIMAILPVQSFDYDEAGFKRFSVDMTDIPHLILGLSFVLFCTFMGGLVPFQKMDRFYYNHRETKRVRQCHANSLNLLPLPKYHAFYHPDHLIKALEVAQRSREMVVSDIESRSASISAGAGGGGPVPPLSPFRPLSSGEEITDGYVVLANSPV